MSKPNTLDEVENHIVRRYELKKRLGKGVSSFFMKRLDGK